MVQRVTTNDNEWQQMITSGTTNDNEWQGVVQRVTTSGTTSDNKWKRMITSGTTNDNEWHNEWKRMKTNESNFRFQNETIMLCVTTIYPATPFWKYKVKQNICRSSHQRCSTKKATLKNFAIFIGKHLKACNFIKKRLQHKCCEYCEIFKNTCFEEHLQTAASASVFNKNKRSLHGSKNFHKIGLKNWWIGQVLFKQICWCDGRRFPDLGSNSFYF